MIDIIEKDCTSIVDKIDLSALKNKTILITGANGLIGTYLISFLSLANYTYNLGLKLIGVSKNNANKKLGSIFEKDHKFISLDLLTKINFDKLPKTDYLVHGAGYAQPTKFLQNPLESIYLNTIVTERLLKKAKKDKARFLFLSSSEIYGNPTKLDIPTKEDFPGLCSSINTRAVYAESKRLGETYCHIYKSNFNTDALVARLSIIYGPGIGIDDERVMGNFLKMALLNKKIVMQDSGKQIRTFCYITDCVLMLIYLLIYGKDFVYNIGGKDTLSIKKLAQVICKLTDSKLNTSKNSKIIANKSPEKVVLDIGKVQREFNFSPQINITEGLTKTIAWNKQNLNI